MKTTILIIVLIASLVVRFLHLENKKKEDAVKKRMKDKAEIARRIKRLKESSDSKHKVSSLLITMLNQFDSHDNVQPTLTEEELHKIEEQLQLKLPQSYKLFLKYFGDGGSWIYANSIDSIRQLPWLCEYRTELDETIELYNEKTIKTNTLLCLMTEDSNGGAWCWLTSEATENGEWPLAYYSLDDKKLHYKVENFTEWLTILVHSQGEVIMELDVDDNLGLG